METHDGKVIFPIYDWSTSERFHPGIVYYKAFVPSEEHTVRTDLPAKVKSNGLYAGLPFLRKLDSFANQGLKTLSFRLSGMKLAIICRVRYTYQNAYTCQTS